nr:potassium channel subfamily K member 16-like [Lytechinus pictus]
MEQNAWQTRTHLLAVLVIFWIYLFIGALIFTSIERRHADNLHHRFLHTAIDFVANNSCVDHGDLQTYSNVLIDVYTGGLRWTTDQGFNSSKHHYHHWDLVDSLFFCATVVTTIGYGNLAPSTELGRSICIIYALIGIPLSGLLVTIIGQQLKKRLRGIWRRLLVRLHCITTRESSIAHRIASFMAVVVAGVAFYVILIIIPACLFNYIEGWNWLTSQYYAFISFTTIGFGDYVAGDGQTLTAVGRVVYKVILIFYLVFGMGFVTMLLQGLQHRNAQKVRQFAQRRVIRRIRKKKRKAGLDEADGSFSKEMPSESDEYVVITTDVVGDDCQGEVFEMQELESGVAFETVSLVDDVMQTQSTLTFDAATQTDRLKVDNGCCCCCHSKSERDNSSTMTSKSSQSSSFSSSELKAVNGHEMTWKITENLAEYKP